MRLRQIEIFHAVYVNGSISAAARTLNVSQPAVSKVLRHTETRLGIRLFDVIRGRLVPTDEAHALYREVDEVFHRISSLQITAGNLKNAGAGHLRIGVVPSLGLEVLPRAIAEFRQAHPGVTFDIKTIHHSDLLRALYERECDVAFGYDPPQHPRLALRRLARAQIVAIAAPGRFAPGLDHLKLHDLAGADLIGVTSSGPVGDIVAAIQASENVAFHEIATVDTYYIAAALVREGAGIALVDQFTAQAMRGEALAVFRLAPDLSFSVQAAWLEDRPLSKLAEQLILAMRQTLARQVAA